MKLTFSLEGKRVWVAGHRGMVGSAILRRLAQESCEILVAGRADLDLRDQRAVLAWMQRERPEAVFVAAAKVGGIIANRDFPADFLYDNLMIEANIVQASHETGVEKLLFLGSSCIYPKLAPQPMREADLLTGPLEPTNEWYAIAKIAGVKLCQAYRRQYGDDFISAMPTNLYGPGDNFDLAGGHVLPALMRKAHEAKLTGQAAIEVWGSGSPLREFLHVDDLADACLFLMKHYSDDEHVNVGSGQEVSIRELSEIMCRAVGFDGELAFDSSKPNGTPRKLLDVSKLSALGWSARIGLQAGIAQTYRWYCENKELARL
jgi:GDP-L-fucose synthase